MLTEMSIPFRFQWLYHYVATADNIGNWLLVPTFFCLRSQHKLSLLLSVPAVPCFCIRLEIYDPFYNAELRGWESLWIWKCLRACAWNGIELEIVLPFSNLTLTFYFVISYPNEILSNIYFGLRRNEHKLRKNKFH